MFHCLSLGTIDYREGLRIQQKLRERVIKEGEGWFLTCEHKPVITYGRLANKGNLLVSEKFARNLQIELIETNRGGDFTYHGYGMLMGYFILDLRLLNLDCVRFLREIEEIIISTLGDFEIQAFRVPNFTGVWCQVGGEEKKICSCLLYTSPSPRDS